MNNIKDNYTQGFPGVIKQIETFKDLVKKFDNDLDHHLTENMVDYHEFGFKWMYDGQLVPTMAQNELSSYLLEFKQ